MCTFEQIQEANKTIVTTNIKGKDYAEVNQRIKAFRMVHPNGRIITELTSLKDGVCIFRASIYNDQDELLGTGTAYEKENSTFINKTSYIENAETSSVGRALGMLGFGIDTSVASAEEVANAIENQKPKKKTAEEVKKEEAERKEIIDLATYICDFHKSHPLFRPYLKGIMGDIKNVTALPLKTLREVVQFIKDNPHQFEEPKEQANDK